MSSMNPATMLLSDLAELIAVMKTDIKPATVNHHNQLANLEKQLAVAFDAGRYSVIEDLERLLQARTEEAKSKEPE